MSRPIDNNDSPLSLDVIDEDRVRRALGLKTSGSTPTHQQRPEQARQRHRFVTDGSVPVVMLNRSDSESGGLKDRLSSTSHALESERAAHAATKRLLQEAQQARQALQTRIGHMEMSHHEILRAEQDARRQAEEALVALRAEADEALVALRSEADEALIALRAEADEAIAALHAEMDRPREPVLTAAPLKQRREIRASEPIPRQKRPANEPKPVRWWTPSYRSKQR